MFPSILGFITDPGRPPGGRDGPEPVPTGQGQMVLPGRSHACILYGAFTPAGFL